MAKAGSGGNNLLNDSSPLRDWTEYAMKVKIKNCYSVIVNTRMMIYQCSPKREPVYGFNLLVSASQRAAILCLQTSHGHCGGGRMIRWQTVTLITDQAAIQTGTKVGLCAC